MPRKHPRWFEHWSSSSGRIYLQLRDSLPLCRGPFAIAVRPRLLDGGDGSPQPAHDVPLTAFGCFGRGWKNKPEAPHIREIGSPAPWRKHAVAEPDVGIDVTRKDYARPHEVGAHDADAAVGGLQAIGELLRQDDERGAVAVPAYVKAAAAVHTEAHVARRNQRPLIGSYDDLATEIKVSLGKTGDDLRARIGKDNFGRTVIAHVGMGQLIDLPLAVWVRWMAPRKAEAGKLTLVSRVEGGMIEDITHPQSLEGLEQNVVRPACADPRPGGVHFGPPLEQFDLKMDELGG